MVFVLGQDGKSQIIQMDFVDKSSKFMQMNKLAEVISESKAKSVITIFEAWISSDIVGYIKGGSLENVREKRECLSFSLIRNDGYQENIDLFFKRNLFRNIIFEERVTDNEKRNLFTPIYKVWGLK